MPTTMSFVPLGETPTSTRNSPSTRSEFARRWCPRLLQFDGDASQPTRMPRARPKMTPTVTTHRRTAHSSIAPQISCDFTARFAEVDGWVARDPVTPYRDDPVDRGATDSAGTGASPPFAARWFIPRLTAWAHRTARHSTHGPSRSNGVGVADLGGPLVSEVECPQQVTLPCDRRVGPACRRGRDFGLVRASKVLLGRIGCLRSS
jgi:hypothetical protein